MTRLPVKMSNDRSEILSYSRSARQDVATWAMFIVGVFFVFAALQIEPRSNCDEAGHCAPWLVYAARVLGAVFASYGLWLIVLNPNRGSHIDVAKQEFVWWQNRRYGYGGLQGQIQGANISRIRIAKHEESGDALHIYDAQGNRFFRTETLVTPPDIEGWAKALTNYWPHILLDTD